MTNAKVIIFILFSLSLQVWAYTAKEGNVSATFGPFFSQTDYRGSSTYTKAPVFADFGLIVQGDINETGALEIAIFNMHKDYFINEDGKTLVEETRALDFDLGYRYWLNSTFAAGLAFSSAYSMGEPRLIHTDFIVGQLESSAHDPVEYGLDFSLQGELWRRDAYSIIADARYNLSFTNKSHEQGNHYGIEIGFKYLIQEKFPEMPKQSDNDEKD